MSEQKQTRRPGPGRGSFRKRRPPTTGAPATTTAAATTKPPRGPRPPRAEGQAKPAAENGDAPKRERPPSYTWPASDVGKTLTGTVVSVIRRGRFNFGFIALSTDKEFYDPKYPRVYFNPSHVSTQGLFLRTGYQVSFTATNDEEGRSVATNIALTEEGDKTKAEREEAIAKKRAERQESGEKPEGASSFRGQRRTRRPRPEPVDGRKVNLKVTCDGNQETKNVDVNLGHSIGELRANASALFNAPANYAIYLGGALLNRETYADLQDNNSIHLAPRKEN